MRFHKFTEKIASYDPKALMNLFDQASYTLGFSSLESVEQDLLDTEAAILTVAYLIENGSLKLDRFLGPLLVFIDRHRNLIIHQKFKKMGDHFESTLKGGEFPLYRLLAYVLNSKTKLEPLTQKFYLSERLSNLAELRIEQNGLLFGLPEYLGIRISEGSVRFRDQDLLPDKVLFDRNEQLRLRLLMGANYRSDVLKLMKTNPDISAREVARILLLSYEPANRLCRELKEYKKYGYAV